jgi:di/tricarboxylate transporter
MTGEQIAILGIIAAMAVFLYRGRPSAAVVFLSSAAMLTALGVLTPGEALSGFANESIAVMIMLILVSQIIRRTRFIEFLFEKFLRPATGYRSLMGIMMWFASAASALMNNAPVVAMLIPHVGQWGRKHGISASRLLIPVSYAAVLGGTVTLIGTSTNLIVNSLATGSGLPSLAIFDFVWVGVPLVLVGLLYMLTLGRRLLPQRKDPVESFVEHPREYLVEVVVPKGSPLVGRSVEQAELRNLKGLFLAEILRADHRISPVGPSEVLEEGDVLILVGVTRAVAELVDSFDGLAHAETFSPPDHERLKVLEAVVSPRSSLAGRLIRESDFRARYDSAILAVHRQGSRLGGKIGEIRLRPGDLLLLVAGRRFERLADSSGDFYLVSSVREVHNINVWKSVFIVAAALACVVGAAVGLFPLFHSLLVLLSLLLLTRITNPGELKSNLDLNLVAVAAFALALGVAVGKTGLGALFADWVISLFEPVGAVGVLAAIYFVTNTLANLITTPAAASIVFPFSVAAAASLGVDPKPFVLVVAYAAACNFSTPMGYQTNLMVYGPGGYQFGDYLRVGLPLKAIAMAVVVAGLAIRFGLA